MKNEAPGLTRHEAFAADIDIRMLEMFEFFGHFEEERDREIAIQIARAAYYLGYYDAFREPSIGSLFLDNGWSMPKRRLM